MPAPNDTLMTVAPTIPCERSPDKRSGVGLIEVVVALFIFAATVTGMCGLVLILRESSDRARDHYVAVNLAKNRLERAKSFGFSQLSMFAENQIRVNNMGVQTPNGEYRRTTLITNVNPTLTEIRVTVEIRNRETWEFVPGEEDIRSYVADILEHE